MRNLIPSLLFFFLLTGCAMRRFTPPPEPAVPTLSYTQCAWKWATQSLPELSVKVEAGMQTAGLKNVTVRAEAYGENCIGAAGKVDHFAALETDFHITAKVADLTDEDDLGNILEKILGTLDAFPTGETPGPQPGTINVVFQAGNNELNIMFSVTAGKTARAQGIHGAALFELLRHK